MIAHLVSLHMTYDTIGILRGVNAFTGLLGTVLFGTSSRSRGLAFTGLWSIMLQFWFLGLCYISIYLNAFPHWALWLLVVGTWFSRIGLWSFDLTMTQYMQQEIPEDIRGVIGGVQNSLNGVFNLMTFVLGLIFSDPQDFHILVSISYCSVGVAVALYYFGVYKQRHYTGKYMNRL